jgi:hypothetical protein
MQRRSRSICVICEANTANLFAVSFFRKRKWQEQELQKTKENTNKHRLLRRYAPHNDTNGRVRRKKAKEWIVTSLRSRMTKGNVLYDTTLPLSS